MNILTFVLSTIFTFFLTMKNSAQESRLLVFSQQVDLNRDGQVEQMNLYRANDYDYGPNEFSEVELILSTGVVLEHQLDVMVQKPKLYEQHSESSLQGYLGLFHKEHNSYLWFTGYPYSCCPNRTILLAFNGTELQCIFNEHAAFMGVNNNYWLGVLELEKQTMLDKILLYYLPSHLTSTLIKGCIIGIKLL